MKASKGQIGRVFVIRLEEGDMLPECIERFAAENKVSVGHVIMVGGIDRGEIAVGPRDIVTGPRRPEEKPFSLMRLPIETAHEVMGIGVLAPDASGKPALHLHAAFGRSGQTLTGDLRFGAKTWLVGEVILYEILGAKAARLKGKESGLTLFEVEPD